MKRILCLGDSNTYGYDPRSYFGSRYGADVRWTGRLRDMGWEVVNCGQNGLSIPRASQLRDLAGLIGRLLPLDWIALMLGSNDLLGGASAEETSARMEKLLQCVTECAPGVGAMLIAPPPMQPGDWVGERRLVEQSARLGALYRRLADAMGIAFADAGEWGVSLSFDGVHFTPAGHEAFAGGLSKALSTARTRSEF